MSPPSATRIGVIGLGLLGSALAERLLGAGYDVRVWNRTLDKAAPLIAVGATVSQRPLAECERVVVCLYTSQVVEEVLQHFASDLRPGQTIVDTTTGDPDDAPRTGARLREHGVDYLEAPIAASSQQTRDGQATSWVAGDQSAYEQARDIFAAIAPQSYYVGAWGNAAKLKLVNNLILGLNRAVLAEGLAFAEALGLDATTTLEALRHSNAQSGVMETKGRKMIERDYALQAKLVQHAKDVRLMLSQAEARGMTLPLSTLHLELLDRATSAGWGEADNSAIIEVLRSSRTTSHTAQ